MPTRGNSPTRQWAAMREVHDGGALAASRPPHAPPWRRLPGANPPIRPPAPNGGRDRGRWRRSDRRGTGSAGTHGARHGIPARRGGLIRKPASEKEASEPSGDEPNRQRSLSPLGSRAGLRTRLKQRSVRLRGSAERSNRRPTPRSERELPIGVGRMHLRNCNCDPHDQEQSRRGKQHVAEVAPAHFSST